MVYPDRVVTCSFDSDLNVSEIVSSLRQDQLVLIEGVDFTGASDLILEAARCLGLSTDSQHHFNNMGDPFRVAVNEAFHEVSRYGGHSIFFHNENAYSQNTPELTSLYCDSNSLFGGENVFLNNQCLAKVRGGLIDQFSHLFARKRLSFTSRSAFNESIARLPNFASRSIQNIEDYVDHLAQYTELSSVEITDIGLEVVHPVNFYKQSSINQQWYLQVPSDGTCRVSFHLKEFCDRHGLFYNPMFQYLQPPEQASDTVYFMEKECLTALDLNQALFEVVLIAAYTQAVPIKLPDKSLCLFNNKSWMHSVNVPGPDREMYVSYAYLPTDTPIGQR